MQRLTTDQLAKNYRGRQVVRGVSLEIHKGEVVGLLGPNGAGKTTTFYMIVGLVEPDAGRVLVGDREITRLPMYLRARNFGISYLPQEPSVFRKLTVEENILAVLEVQPGGWQQRRARMERLIEQLSLGHVRKTRGYALSGGERRRVEIARCLSIEPNFILLDEPFSGIDPIAVHGFAGHHFRFEGQRLWRPDHRPQCARDPHRDRPRLHHQRRKDFPDGHARRAGAGPGSAARLPGRRIHSELGRIPSRSLGKSVESSADLPSTNVTLKKLIASNLNANIATIRL